MHRTLYTLKNTPGPAHSRLVAGTADMAQKWPEVVSPRPLETEVPEVPTAALLPLLFSCQSFSCKVSGGKGKVPLSPTSARSSSPSLPLSQTLFVFRSVAIGWVVANRGHRGHTAMRINSGPDFPASVLERFSFAAV